MDPVIVKSSKLADMPFESFAIPSRGQCVWKTLISAPTTVSNSLTAGVGTCAARGDTLAVHTHRQAEIYYILSGRGTLFVDDEEHHVEPGDVAWIPGQAKHGIRNEQANEPLTWFYCFGVDGFGDINYVFTDTEVKAPRTIEMDSRKWNGMEAPKASEIAEVS